MSTSALEALALRASRMPFFLGNRLEAWKARHGTNAEQLAQRLGIAPDKLPEVYLCRTPLRGTQSWPQDLAAIGRRFGIPRGLLAEVLDEAGG